MSSRALILQRLREATVGPIEGSDFIDAQVTESAAGVDRYRELAQREGTTVDQVATLNDLPAVVCKYLRSMQLPTRVVIDGGLQLPLSAWADAGVTAIDDDLRKDGGIFVGTCLGAIADSGAFVISSGAEHSLALDFLAATHIVVLPVAHIHADFEALWVFLRARAEMPREFCMVTGPSRTADLGVPAKFGAHGPIRVHVILIEGLSV